MKNYIDAEKLIAEIEALKRRKGFLPFENTEITEAYMARGVQFTCDDIVNLIQSLQREQPEVDLKEEIDRELDTRWKGEYLSTSKFRESARHFYELGLNAIKEE